MFFDIWHVFAEWGMIYEVEKIQNNYNYGC